MYIPQELGSALAHLSTFLRVNPQPVLVLEKDVKLRLVLACYQAYGVDFVQSLATVYSMAGGAAIFLGFCVAFGVLWGQGIHTTCWALANRHPRHPNTKLN